MQKLRLTPVSLLVCPGSSEGTGLVLSTQAVCMLPTPLQSAPPASRISAEGPCSASPACILC